MSGGLAGRMTDYEAPHVITNRPTEEAPKNHSRGFADRMTDYEAPSPVPAWLQTKNRTSTVPVWPKTNNPAPTEVKNTGDQSKNRFQRFKIRTVDGARRVAGAASSIGHAIRGHHSFVLSDSRSSEESEQEHTNNNKKSSPNNSRPQIKDHLKATKKTMKNRAGEALDNYVKSIVKYAMYKNTQSLV